MHGAEQDVIGVSELKQPRPNERSAGEIEGLGPFRLQRGARTLTLKIAGQTTEIGDWQWDRRRLLHELPRFAIILGEACPQDLVPLDNGVERALQRRAIERSA